MAVAVAHVQAHVRCLADDDKITITVTSGASGKTCNLNRQVQVQAQTVQGSLARRRTSRRSLQAAGRQATPRLPRVPPPCVCMPLQRAVWVLIVPQGSGGGGEGGCQGRNASGCAGGGGGG